MREDERDRVARQGTEAWRRLKKEKSWGDWLKVGEALQVGREWAMNQAGTNAPTGKAYNMAFGEWMSRYKLDDMDKGDRSRLFSVMDNLGPIEEWRKTLTLTERLKLNHPNAVWRKWRAAMEPEPAPAPAQEGPPKPTLRDSVANLSEENARLTELVAELEAARQSPPGATTLRELWKGKDWHEMIEDMIATLRRDRFETLIREASRVVEEEQHVAYYRQQEAAKKVKTTTRTDALYKQKPRPAG